MCHVSTNRRSKSPSVKASYTLTGNFVIVLTHLLQHLSSPSKICHYHTFVLNFVAHIGYSLTNLWQHLFNDAKFTKVLQVSTFTKHIRHSYFFYWNRNTTGYISSRTAHHYEGFRTNPPSKLASLSSVFLILGSEIRDVARNYTECNNFSN